MLWGSEQLQLEAAEDGALIRVTSLRAAMSGLCLDPSHRLDLLLLLYRRSSAGPVTLIKSLAATSSVIKKTFWDLKAGC